MSAIEEHAVADCAQIKVRYSRSGLNSQGVTNRIDCGNCAFSASDLDVKLNLPNCHTCSGNRRRCIQGRCIGLKIDQINVQFHAHGSGVKLSADVATDISRRVDDLGVKLNGGHHTFKPKGAT